MSNIFDMYLNQIKLLPRYFKIAGLLIIVISVLLRIWANALMPDFKLYVPSLIILGMSIIAFSRNKVEDELTLLIRLKAMSAAFVFGLIEVILKPIFNNWFDYNLNETDSGRLIGKMLFFYFLFFYFFRRQQNK
ncbi:MAG TPA: hypothetical protein VGD22_13580 [Sphingobacteriaceae bacterium]